MIVDDFTRSYYVVFCALIKHKESRLLPFPFQKKEDADNFFSKVTSDNKSQIINNLIVDATEATEVDIEPFLYIEKSIISSDNMEESVNSLGVSYGSISSDFIPMDYVSKIYYDREIKNIESSEYIKSIILESKV